MMHQFKLRHREVFTKHGHLRLRFVCVVTFLCAFILVGATSIDFSKMSDYSLRLSNIDTNLIDAVEEEVALTPTITVPLVEMEVEEMASPAVSEKEIPQLVTALPTKKPAKRMFTVKSGDSLSGILESAALTRGETYDVIQALKDAYDPRDMKVGQKILVDVEKQNDAKIFKGLYIQKNQLDYVKLAKLESGSYDVQSLQRDFKVKKGYASTRIDESAPSLYVALRRQNVPAEIIADMIRYYSWDVDFQRDIHQGNTIEVYYESAMLDNGDHVGGRGKLIYAKLGNIYGTFPMYRYEKKNGRVDYFNDKGESVRKALLSTPVDGARLSSGFGMRKHPVSGYHKMHKGVDFAAPTGTPIYAAGDGVVEKAEWYSSFGKYVRIRHNGDLKTAYAHMHKFGKGVKSGVRVKQGQVIGYIGTTGRSTGPHLHYEVHKAGRQVNPNSLKLPTGEKLKGEDLTSYQTQRANIVRKIQSLSKENERIALLERKNK